MTRYVYEKYTRVWWVTTIAVQAAPTVAEIGAGTDLSSFIAKDGLKLPVDQNMVDNAAIDTAFDAQLVGSWGGGGLELEMFKDTTDTAWTLCVYGTVGFLVVRLGLLVTTAVAAAQKVQVWPAQMHQPVVKPSAANQQVRFTEKLAVTLEPSLNGTVAA